MFVFFLMQADMTAVTVQSRKNASNQVRQQSAARTILWKKNKRTVWQTQYLATCKLYEGDQSWVFIGRTDAEAETPILWPPHAKS